MSALMEENLEEDSSPIIQAGGDSYEESMPNTEKVFFQIFFFFMPVN